MVTNTLYRDPSSGRIGTVVDAWESERAGVLAMSRAQAEDSLSASLLGVYEKNRITGAAISTATDSYNKIVSDPERKRVIEVKKPVSLVLVFLVGYLVLQWV